VGCLDQSEGCDVTFSVDYQLPGGFIYNLGAWQEDYDGDYSRIDIDLSSLAGQSVQFILTVANNGNPTQANAFWLAPSIRSTVQGSDIPAARAARRTLAMDLNVDIDEVVITKVEAVEWRDSCLETGLPREICGPENINGYRILLSGAGRRYEARTNQDGTLIYWFQI
jgi:hypothetical protein